MLSSFVYDNSEPAGGGNRPSDCSLVTDRSKQGNPNSKLRPLLVISGPHIRRSREGEHVVLCAQFSKAG